MVRYSDIGVDDGEKTQPPTQQPVSILRYPTPHELYTWMPQLLDLTQLRPGEAETNAEFLSRLSQSPTPEEAVTFTSFAVLPRMSVWWGYESLRSLRSDFSQDDRDMLERIAQWSTNGDTALRYEIMKAALFAERRTATMVLGLAAGWSGSQIAPNDPTPVPPYRTPKAVNAAILSALAQCQLANRSNHVSKLIRLAESLFSAY